MDQKKRNLVDEITRIRSRNTLNARDLYKFRFLELTTLLDESKDSQYSKSELLRYIPIATVACFEGFFTALTRDLIDFGAPFNGRIAQFTQGNNIKISYDILSSIQSESITLGDFIAHTLSYSSLQDIKSNIKTLIGDDLISKLKSFNIDSIHSEIEKTCLDFKNRHVEILNSVNRTYELRHIFCHELALNFKLDEAEILTNFYNCEVFLDHVSNYISNLLYPNAPETQSEMNVKATTDFESIEAEFELLVSRIRALIDGRLDGYNLDLENFDKAIESWKKYREHFAEYTASCVIGGSAYGLIYAEALHSKTREKIISLKKEFKELVCLSDGIIANV